MGTSNCCSAHIIEGDICEDCLEHCEEWETCEGCLEGYPVEEMGIKKGLNLCRDCRNPEPDPRNDLRNL